MSEEKTVFKVQMDKPTSQALTVIILGAGIIVILLCGLILYGVDVLVTVFGVLMPIVTIVSMYLGFTIQADKYTVANLTQLIAQNHAIISKLTDALSRQIQIITTIKEKVEEATKDG